MFWWCSCPSSRDFLERSIRAGQTNVFGNDGNTVVPRRGPEAGLGVLLSGESLVHPDRLPRKAKWKWASTQTCSPVFKVLNEVFRSESVAKMENWMPLTHRFSSLPPPCSALCPHLFRFPCLFICCGVLFILFPSHLFPACLSITPASLILETFRHNMSVRKNSKTGH